MVVERTREALEVGGRARVSETGEEIEILVEGEDDSALLIGKHGATIDALQHIAARVAFRGREGERKRVVIDAAGYRDRRQATLERAAERAADEALSFGRAVELEPMSSFERRLVHNHLADRSDVDTHSEGDEPDRRLVVTPRRGAPPAR
ncbi:MAG TPA: R3H domain-containing nucleic acid-binding protein [Thermoleophilaceae bacterium]|nr:R3H domain-containing nucleic acid-binding protein [Thermoleophilaceae bacterium]